MNRSSNDDLNAGRMILLLCKSLVLVENRVEYVHKVLQGELVEVVDVVKLLQNGKDSTAGSSNDAVLAA